MVAHHLGQTAVTIVGKLGQARPQIVLERCQHGRRLRLPNGVGHSIKANLDIRRAVRSAEPVANMTNRSSETT